jgi:hypothetical protein
MQFFNSEVATFAGNSGTQGMPTYVENFYLKDRSGNVLMTFTKDVTGAFSCDLYASTKAEVDQLNDVSAYQESIIAAGALSVTKVYSGLALVGAGAVTLAAPDATMLGQQKTIEMTTDNGDVTLALTNVVGQSSGTTATFNDVNDCLILIAKSNKWVVIKENGIALS